MLPRLSTHGRKRWHPERVPPQSSTKVRRSTETSRLLSHQSSIQSTSAIPKTDRAQPSQSPQLEVRTPAAARDKRNPGPKNRCRESKKSQGSPQRMAGNVVETLLNVQQKSTQSIPIQICQLQGRSQLKPNGFRLP